MVGGRLVRKVVRILKGASKQFGATQNTINFDQQNFREQKNGDPQKNSQLVFRVLPGAQLFGKWPCFAQIAHSLKHQPVAVDKKNGERHGKTWEVL